MSLILCIQYCPLDEAEAHHLCKLLVDLEPEKRSDVEFAVSIRRDSDVSKAQELVKLLETKFQKVHFHRCTRSGKGWPHGCNDLWFDTMTWGYELLKHRQTRASGIFTFEADNVPLKRDWINILAKEWKERGEGVHVVGNKSDDPSPHINGNGIFALDLYERYPAKMTGCSGTQGWDMYIAKTFLPVSKDSSELFQVYKMQDITRESLDAIKKNGNTPAFFHGTKGTTAIDLQRDKFFAKEKKEEPKKAKAPATPKEEKPEQTTKTPKEESNEQPNPIE